MTIESKDSLSKIITLESGKPLEESKVEVEYGASFIEWAAEQALRSEGKLLESPENNKKMFYIKRPVGVVVAITPWNFPLAMVTRKVSAALAAGCSVILKPSELTPLTALKFGELAIKAGLPNGVLNIINGNPKLIGELLTKNSLVKKITFTGSTEVGKLLMKDSSSTVKNISLELGGNAPFVVFFDADISNAIEGFIALQNLEIFGQTCISANRLFVEEKIFDKFLKKLIVRIKNLKVGNGFEKNDVGPLISEKAIKKIKNHIDDALSKGGKILIGGKKSKIGKLFFEPTIVTNINTKMKIFNNENFGPIIPVINFKSDDELIQLANDTNYGLAAYFYTKKGIKGLENNRELGVWNVRNKLWKNFIIFKSIWRVKRIWGWKRALYNVWNHF